jgi:polyphosphate kinase 2 (PPK2 family)
MATVESMRHTARGALIVLEGLDRSGKSSQAAHLAENLRQRGHSVKSLQFPGEFRGLPTAPTFLIVYIYR